MIRTLIFFFSFLFLSNIQSQSLDIQKIKSLIEQYKEETRGPYKDIRWFCKDGTFSDPKVPCNQEGSVQRARYRDEVENLGKRNQIYLGQILAGTNPVAFWDEKNFHERYKQYQVEQYLRANDDGWINRKAQFYRGAIQVEDEMKWGKELLLSLLKDSKITENEYFILKQAVRTIPHEEDDNTKQKVRAISKNISDEDTRFMSLRIKIHGNPDKSDIRAVEEYKKSKSPLKISVATQIDELLSFMNQLYAPIDIAKKINEIGRLAESVPSRALLIDAYKTLESGTLDFEKFVTICNALEVNRKSIIRSTVPARKLRLLDFAMHLEDALFTRISEIKTDSLGDLTTQICYMGSLAYSSGYLEEWEWEYLEGQLSTCQTSSFELYDLVQFQQDAKNAVEWSVNMVRAHFNPTINTWGQFEPKSYGIVDEIVRSGPLLRLGQMLGILSEFLNAELNYSNKVIGVSNSAQIRGLNAGFAKGKLRVVSGNVEELEIKKSEIYIFDQPPSDLKPIAGIATVSEGNPVSHIQLLARNLGIPNAVISKSDFNQLKKYDGDEIFYAVSPKGNIILKSAKDLSKVEAALFEVKARAEDKISVPTDKLKIKENKILNMRDLDRHSSGIYCGPKAANLAELKKLFPDKVVEGIVIPFGIFKKHMDQLIPGRSISYWQFVNETFAQAKTMTDQKKSSEEVEKFTLDQLANLREEIKKMKLLPDFEKEMREQFKKVLGGDIGTIPVFLRSDTNMEDLKDFTGAGLNLTIFNVLKTQEILQGIKDVWASPYSERSFKWRQKFLLNPESVYPSILIIPSVDVEYSGVLITKGLKTNDFRDMTVAMNRGVGGAVDGQAAESYTLHHGGFNYLNAPAREIKYRYLPKTGGSQTAYTYFSKPVLNSENLREIRQLTYNAWTKIKLSENSNDRIAYDIEFGFLKNKLWLFQVRPFVENKNAQSSNYLNSITPRDVKNKMIPYSTLIKK